MCIFALGAAGAAAGGAASMSTGLGMMLSIAQAAVGYMGAMQQYNAQIAHMKKQEIQAQKTLNLQVSQQQAALESEKDKAQGALADAAIEVNAKQSTAGTMAAESGIVGISVDNLKGAILGEGGRYKQRIMYNSEVAQMNAENELKMAQRGAAARLAEIPIPTKPSFLPFAVQGLSGIVSGMGKMEERRYRGYYT